LVNLRVSNPKFIRKNGLTIGGTKAIESRREGVNYPRRKRGK
jgi:hypothetical protein